MNNRKTSFLSRLCMAVLSLLGFTACENPYICEYGTPNVDYKVSGTVTDEEGTPIEGIRVIMPGTDYDYERNCFVGDTLFTDANGEYATPEHNDICVAKQGIFFDDVDGEAHGGVFASDSLTQEEVYYAPRKQYKKGDGNWYDGGYEYTVNISLKKQEK